MDENEIKKLYSALLGKGYTTKDLGDEATFSKKMADKSNRKQLYDWVSSKGNFRIGDYDTYERRITGDMSGQENPGSEAGQAAAPTPGVATAPAAEQPAQLPEQEKMRMSAGVESMERSIRRSSDGINQRFDDMREYRDKARLGGGQAVEGGFRFNPESGKMEKTYLTPLGNRYGSKEVADLESFNYRQAADMSVGAQLRRANRRLAELKAKRQERASEVLEETEKFNKEKLTPLGRLTVGQDMHVAKQQGDKQNNAYDAAIRDTEDLIARLERAKERGEGVDVGFWRGFGKVMGSVGT